MGSNHIIGFINKLVVSYGFIENRDGARGPQQVDLHDFFYFKKITKILVLSSPKTEEIA